MSKKTPKRTKAESNPPITIIDACHDPDVFGSWFKDRKTWAVWFTFLRVVFGLPLDEAELAVFQKFTGRTTPLPAGYLEATLICGRRAGKSLILALIAAFLAAFHDWSPYLTGGERGGIVVVAADRKQARAIFRYLKEMLSIPLLAGLIERETQESVDLSNGITVEILAANFKTIRGRTVVASLLDEEAFWPTDEGLANPDIEIVNAIRPSMATVPGAMMLKASSPYAKRGDLYEDFKRHFGDDASPVLVWKAATRDMNPTVSEKFIATEYARDPSNANAEYGAEFRSDLEAFVSREVVEAAVVPDRHELPRTDATTYVAFCDPSGGSSDSMTLALCHMEGDRAVLDLVREYKPPFSPDHVVEEFAAAIRAYGIATVRGDRYGGLWPRERFAAHKVDYQVADKTTSEIYGTLLPLLNSHRVDLLDHPRLVSQLINLERRVARSGRDSISHPPGQHDDVVTAVAGAVVYAAARAAQTVPIAPPIIMTKSGEISATTGPSGPRPPRHYLKGHNGPWVDVTEAHHWGPVSTGRQYFGPV
jgi:hypothetical protein